MKFNSNKSINLLIITVFVLIVSAGGAFSTELLSGIITDLSSDNPLDGATIRLGKSDQSMPAIEVMTGNDGKYEIPDLAPGVYDLIISYLGFKSQVLNKAVIIDGANNVIDIALIPSAINLDAISVTASRRKEKLLDAPAAVSIVSLNQIQVVDLNVNYEFLVNTRLSLTVQNVFDNKHTEFIGAPEIG
ncbi:MAG: carboxypeptidase regulatory-like domain-containing protein, partial [candidate division Zixibacteria bacterium]|nr:carboxypeptidase regulatory-like domain-containing protein [candidate division Zixibacteria bacterium]